MSEFDYDVVVVGSGFGGSVAALRAAEKGYRVLVFEAGRRFEDEDFAKTSWDVRRYLWAPQLGCYGVQRIHKLPDVLILAGAGVGGGSLNYANTLYVPGDAFFKDRQWSNITDWRSELEPHYEVAKRMLGVVEENPCEGPIEQLMRDTATDLGVRDSFRKTPCGVFFGESGVEVDDPYFGGEGPRRTGCTECGNCMVGCRVGAKNTLMKNYLALAERRGVRIEAMRTVTDLQPYAGGWRITTRRTGPMGSRDVRSVTAGQVVLAAGTWGTQSLLHSLKASGRLPMLSDQLGVLTRTNSEELGGAATLDLPKGVDVTKGVAITSSFHIDDTTHIENVRYGKGSDAMGFFSTLLVPGDNPHRFRYVVKELAKRPVTLLKAATPMKWSQRTVIALVMQTLDNSVTVSAKRRLRGGWKFTSRQGHGEPNPTWIPQGHKAIHALADRLTRLTGKETFAGGTWNELFDVPMTAHFLGGVVISDSPEHGVIDPYHRVWGYPTLHVTDGSTVSANLGVNPSLTITAQAERAMSMWPALGEADERPVQGSSYRRIVATPGRVPGVSLGMPGARPA